MQTNRKTIWNRVKTEKGWRYIHVETGRGHRTGELLPPFYVRPSVKGAQSWIRLQSTTFADAKQEAESLVPVFDAQSKGLTVKEAEDITNANRIPVKRAIETYLTHKQSKARTTVQQYVFVLNQFLETVTELRVRFLDEITEDVLRKYKARLEREGYSGTTIDNRLTIVSFVLKKNNIPARLARDERPTVEHAPAVPYTEDELKRLFAVMTDEERIRYKFFLGTGARDREVMFATWQDIDFTNQTFHVRPKPDVGFHPKSHESRTVPMPTSLVDALKAWQKSHPDGRWIFPNGDGNPDSHFLSKLKQIALRAGLNCGLCRTTYMVGHKRNRKIEVTCKTHPVCSHYFLHRLRKTAATRWADAGVPMQTIRAYLGHKDLSTTQRYLGVSDTNKMRPLIDAAFGD